jgi:hypothetical protein
VLVVAGVVLGVVRPYFACIESCFIPGLSYIMINEIKSEKMSILNAAQHTVATEFHSALAPLSVLS